MYEREKKRLASMVDFEKNREKTEQRRHSAMLVADSLTNLASMYARSKGARYAMGTNMAAPKPKGFLRHVRIVPMHSVIIMHLWPNRPLRI